MKALFKPPRLWSPALVFFTTLLIGATAIVASPTLVSRAGVTTLTSQKVASYQPFASMARAANCSPAKLRTWSCGTACNALSGIQEVVSEGSIAESYWFVGYYPTLDTIVVSNRGAVTDEPVTSLLDADVALTSLDPALFPGVPPSVQVRNGFASSQAGGAQRKLAAVQDLIAKHSSASITLAGLGPDGAVSLLDAIYLQLHISGGNIKVVTHGMARVGNQEFANYVDSHLSNVSRITNMKGPIPILPGRFLGFHHSSGEKHIVSGNSWAACAGQDNDDALCSTGAVPNVFAGNPGDNQGPYNDVLINYDACDA